MVSEKQDAGDDQAGRDDQQQQAHRPRDLCDLLTKEVGAGSEQRCKVG